MTVRKIIQIDEKKCNGCGLCIPSCAEGAIGIINGKAKLINDKFCDGLGACLGECPQNALKIIEREADDFNEKAVEEHLNKIKQKQNKTVKEVKNMHTCPGNQIIDLRDKKKTKVINSRLESELRQWPIQFHLVGVGAPYFDNADLLLAADCVPFAYANFHSDFLKGRPIIIGCPKLDETESYSEKLADIIKTNDVKSVTLVHMEVPCCFGMQSIAEEAIEKSGKNIPLRQSIITVNGEKQ
jgi:Fe-S-cluster-containing hydrogenase component 2